MGPLDWLRGKYSLRGLTVCAYVDDIALHVIGAEALASATLIACGADIVNVLEGDHSMKVSR